MRFFRDRYFKLPLLTQGDGRPWALGRRLPTPRPPVPANQAEADLIFPGIHLVEPRKIRPVSGTDPGARNDYGMRIYYGFSGLPTERYKLRVTGDTKSGSDRTYF
jgi:hypothetical protein